VNPSELSPALRPTFYFIGMSTGKSSIMKVFPKWAEHLGLGGTPIVGIDCKWHDDPAVYRKVVTFIKDDPHSLGGLVTTHKLDLLQACEDLFDELDPCAQTLGEISSISKRDGQLVGHAKDPITSGLSLEAIVPEGHFAKTGSEVCVLGAGGSSLALTTYLMQTRRADDRPACIHVTNRSDNRIEHMRSIHEHINPGIPVQYYVCAEPEQNDAVVASLKPGSVVANSTGLGKDAPGSPLTDAAAFPQEGVAWDFNYRGDLLFLDQANAQKAAQRLQVEDGWVYFLHGWTRVIAEVFNIDIPTSGPAFDKLSEIAASTRTPTRTPTHTQKGQPA